MAQHTAALEAVLQSSFAHSKAGSTVAETVASTEAMVLTGIVTTSVTDSTNEDSIRRCRSALAHKTFGKRIQDASETLDQIISDEALSLTVNETAQRAQHTRNLKKTLKSAMNSTKLGAQFSEMADLQNQALDALLVIYSPGGAKAGQTVPVAAAVVAANLQAIKDA